MTERAAKSAAEASALEAAGLTESIFASPECVARRIEELRDRKTSWSYALPADYQPSVSLLYARNKLVDLGKSVGDALRTSAVVTDGDKRNYEADFKAGEMVIHWYLRRLGLEYSALARLVLMHTPDICDTLEAIPRTGNPVEVMRNAALETIELNVQDAMKKQLKVELQSVLARRAYRARLKSTPRADGRGDHYPYWEDMGPEDCEDFVDIMGVNSETLAHQIIADFHTPRIDRASYICYAMGHSPFERPEACGGDLVPTPVWTNIYRENLSSQHSHNVFEDHFTKLDMVSQRFSVLLTRSGTAFSFGQAYNYAHLRTQCHLHNFPVPTQRRIALMLEDIAWKLLLDNEYFVHSLTKPCVVTVTIGPSTTGPEGNQGEKFVLMAEARLPAEAASPVWLGACTAAEHTPTVYLQNYTFSASAAVANSRLLQYRRLAAKALVVGPNVTGEPCKELPLFVYLDPFGDIMGSSLGPMARIFCWGTDVKEQGPGKTAITLPSSPHRYAGQTNLDSSWGNIHKVTICVNTAHPSMMNSILAYFLSCVWYFYPEFTIYDEPWNFYYPNTFQYQSDMLVFSEEFVVAKVVGCWLEGSTRYFGAHNGDGLTPYGDHDDLQQTGICERIFWRAMDLYYWMEKPMPEFGQPRDDAVFWEEVNLALAYANTNNWINVTVLDEVNLWGPNRTRTRGQGLTMGGAQLAFEDNTIISLPAPPPLPKPTTGGSGGSEGPTEAGEVRPSPDEWIAKEEEAEGLPPVPDPEEAGEQVEGAAAP